MDIFKRGDTVWFEYEKSGHSYERCGLILDGPFNNGFYRIKNGNGAVDFYIHKDKIHYARPDKRIKELEEAYSKAKAMCDNSEPSYPVGSRVRFKFAEKELIGYIQERYQDCRYEIRVENQTYVIKPDSILGYAVNWIDDPSIRKAFGLDIKNDIYENIKKQINKDQLNFNYGLSSPFTLAKIFIDDILKEDNKMNNQKKRNRNIIKTEKHQRTIKDITFNGPAVIVKFEPTGEDLAWGRFKGDKVVVVCKDGDKYDMKTGFLLAILKELLNNQSYGNILEKLDSFDALDIPQVGKDDDFKFKVGDIVRFKHGTARFKVDRCTTFTTGDGKEFPRYRLLRILGTGTYYSTYAKEDEIILADEVYQK